MFPPRLASLGILLDESFLLFSEQHVELIEKASASQAGTLVTMTTISICDTLSDGVVAVVSFFTLPHAVAVAQACLFGFALLAQATLSLVLGQGRQAFALSLVGLKPVRCGRPVANYVGSAAAL